MQKKIVNEFSKLSIKWKINLCNKKIKLKIGKPENIPSNTYHSLKSKKGCVIEEISTQQFENDSIYKNKLLFYIKSL